MNKHQAPKPPAVKTGMFPVVELRPGDRVLVEAIRVAGRKRSQGRLATHLQAMEGSIYATVVSVRHAGTGEISVIVEHPHTVRSAGWEELKVSAIQMVVASKEVR